MLDKAWLSIDGGDYWYENGIRQGFVANDDGTPDLSYRGEEIYDPASDGWYWLDNVDYGKKSGIQGRLSGILCRHLGRSPGWHRQVGSLR